MADRKDYYYKQKVTEAELDAGFEGLEEADRAIISDLGLVGVALGSVNQRGAGANISVDVNTHIAYDDSGQRILVPSVINQPVAVDYLSASTDVSTTGHSKILSVFLVFQRNLSDPRLDGNSVSVFFDRAEGYAVVVKQGAEATSPTAPPLESGKVLICDITRTFGQTQILNSNISVARRQDMMRLTGAGPVTLSATTAKGIAQALQDALNAHISGATNAHAATAIGYAGGPAWRDATTNPAATVEAQLDKIITDLGDSSVNGSARISSLSVSGVNVLLASGSVRSQLVSVLGQLDTLWASLISSAPGAAGSGLVGADALTNLPLGTVHSQLSALDTRSFTSRISPALNWAERGVAVGVTIQDSVSPLACCDVNTNAALVSSNHSARYVTVSHNGSSSKSYTSEDGQAWIERGTVALSTGPSAIDFGNSKFVVTDPSQASVQYSVKGETWSTGITLPANGATVFFGAAFSGGRWYWGCTDGSISYSSDPNTPSTQPTIPGAWVGKSISQFATNGTIIVATSLVSYNKCLTSSDGGTTWLERTLPSTQSWTGVAFDAVGGFIAFGPSGAAKSTDGITWIATNLPNGGIRSLAADGAGLWIATTNGGDYGGVAYSTDVGTTWANVQVGENIVVSGWSRVIYTQKRFAMARAASNATMEFAYSLRR